MSAFRLAAMGDGLVGPLVHIARDAIGPHRSYVDNRFVHWLRVILPDAALADAAVFGAPGDTTVAVAARSQAVLDMDPRPDAVLISAGTEDCLATIRGVAPTADETIYALEMLTCRFVLAGITPIFVLPPPCALFTNGLFADRFIAIAATLRRMQQRERRIELVDATGAMMQRGAFGVEPAPCYVAAASDGRLSSLGAFRLAQEVARLLRPMIEAQTSRPGRRRGDLDALNANPRLTGSGGIVASDAVFGRCATGYRIDVHQLGGAMVRADKSSRRRRDGVQTLTLSGTYTTGWGFLRISQEASPDALVPGDVIEASCDFELVGPVENIAAVSLHVTPVWDNGFIGLHSSRYSGGPGIGEPHAGRLRTPPFALLAKLKKLHVSLQVHLVPGAKQNAAGRLDLRAIKVSRVNTNDMAATSSTGRAAAAALEFRSVA